MAVIDFKTLATGALAFSLAISWNEAVSASIRSLYPNDRQGSAHATVAYAIVITILVIVIVAIINHVKHAANHVISHFQDKPVTQANPSSLSSIIRW